MLLWFSLFFGVMVLLVLIISTALDGAPGDGQALLTSYDSILRPEANWFPGRHPRQPLADAHDSRRWRFRLGIAAALYLEEFVEH